jgi:hypothetical protein
MQEMSSSYLVLRKAAVAREVASWLLESVLSPASSHFKNVMMSRTSPSMDASLRKTAGANPRIGHELNQVQLRNSRPILRSKPTVWFLVLVLMFSVGAARAQWLTQSFTLKPGWNAIFTHVDASYQSLDALLPDANGPVAEIWLWKPTFSTAQFIDTPYADAVANYQWAVWTSARGDTDTLMTLVGNAAYLINNRTAADYVWTVKGRPVPPVYQWTTTGLNFLGFPTPANSAPNFATYLAPAPDLDLAKTLQNSARVFRYPGGNLGESNPSEVVSFTASTTPVSRGQAYWVRGSTNYYNRYYGPVEVSLQNPDGILFRSRISPRSLEQSLSTCSLPSSLRSTSRRSRQCLSCLSAERSARRR